MDSLLASDLYPATTAFDSRWLNVSGGHRLHVEQHGNPNGLPVLVLHGGPGSGCSPVMTRFFDPRRYRVILMDQRGAGRSLPRGGLEANRTEDLIADTFQLQDELGIDRWLLMGGSWGGTLGPLIAAARPERVSGLLLRNPFLARQADLDWFFGGARELFPLQWEAWGRIGAPAKAGRLLPWLEEVLNRNDATAHAAIARVWRDWEQALASLPPLPPADEEQLPALIAKYRLQDHYFMRSCFLAPGAVLRAARGLSVPTCILQGLDDKVCRPAGAAAMQRVLPGSRLHWIEGVGHDAFAPAMVAATRRALDAFAQHGSFTDPQ
ncbi:MAG TPA: alpha/beta fold hydrolase [Rhodocyclaceae bacterium]|nr:alpha/beta fold hydrolase [Rhodocyclaceae bacterium]